MNDLVVNGPNGFYRHFKGDVNDPQLTVKCANHKSGFVKKRVSGKVLIEIENQDTKYLTVNLMDNSYQSGFFKTQLMAPGAKIEFVLDTEDSHDWYDCFNRAYMIQSRPTYHSPVPKNKKLA